MSCDNLSSFEILKFYQQLTNEERRIPFIFDDFHFCRSRVIGLDMTENRIFTLSYDNLSSVSQNVLKFYQQLTGEERRIPFIFDDFHFCRSRVIGLDMTENRIFTLCCMIT
jgi:predicted RNA-binding protein